jgi:YbbR domain-containing protein
MYLVFPNVKRFLKRSFTENLGLKLIAAIISILLYFVVWYQEEAERIIDVQVLPDLPEPTSGLQMMSELPDTVRLRLRGPSTTIKSLVSGDIAPVRIDLRNEGEGVSQHYFSEEDFDIPTGTKFVRVIPESILIKLERLVSKKLPVKIRISGKLKSGTEFAEDPTVSPSSVSAVGPSSIMRELTFVETEDVDIQDLDVGEHIRVVPAKRVENVSLRTGTELKVSLKIKWIQGQRTISSLLVQVGGTEFAADVRPKEVAVALNGPQVALDRLDLSKVVPVAVIKEEDKTRLGTYKSKVEVQGLPENIAVTSVVPPNVVVKLDLMGQAKPKKSEEGEQER